MIPESASIPPTPQPNQQGASLVAQLVKNLPAMKETWVRSLSWEDPLEKGKHLLQYSGMGNSMDCKVHGVAKSRTRLSDFRFPYYLYSPISQPQATMPIAALP